MSANLYCLPLGATARHFFLRRLAQLPAGAGVLVLPSGSLIRQAQREARAEVFGIDTLANKILNLGGYVRLDLLNRRSQEIIVEKLIGFLQERGSFAYFSALAGKRGFVKAMTSLIGQLRRSGATAEQVKDALLGWGRTGKAGQKDMEVTQLYTAYRWELQSRDWFDLEGKFSLATKVLQDATAADETLRLPFNEVYISDFYSFDILQLEFIRALSRQCEVHIGLCYEPQRPEIFAAAQESYAFLSGFCQMQELPPQKQELAKGELAFLRRQLFRPQSAPALAAGGGLRLCEFAGREEEMRAVLKEIKALLRAGDAKPGDILLTMRKLRDYSGLRQLADEYGVPLALPRTAELAAQPVSSFLLQLLAARSETRSGAQAYFALLETALGKLLFTERAEAAQKLRRQKFYSSGTEARLDCQKLFAGCGDTAMVAVNDFLQELPRQAAVGFYCGCLQQLLQRLELPQRLGALYQKSLLTLAELRLALLSLQGCLEVLQQLERDYALCGLAERSLSLDEFADILREALQEITLELEPGQSGGVLVAEAVKVQGLRFKHVYLLGVREGEFPAAPRENWIYDDKERALLTASGIYMPNTALAFAEDAYFFAAAVAQADERLTVSWHRDDEAGPSTYIGELARLFSDLAISAPAAAEAALLREIWRQPCYDAALWLTPAASDALTADKKRSGGAASVYNGVLRQEALLDELRHKVGRQFSASSLEIYAACPFRYLGERVWEQQLLEEKSELAEPADEGDLLHKTLAVFIGDMIAAGRQITDYELPELQERLLALFRELCAAAGAESSVFWQAERSRLEHMLQRWLRYEYKERQEWGILPAATEWDFGSRSGRPLFVPLSAADGDRIAVVGRIDRIDEVGGKLYVTDYKRSTAPAANDLGKGLDLQLPVYLLAAHKLYGGGQEIAGGSYLTLNDLQRKAKVLFAASDYAAVKKQEHLTKDFERDWESFEEHFTELLAAYARGIYAGDFAVTGTQKCIPYCQLRDICRKSAVGTAEGGGEDE